MMTTSQALTANLGSSGLSLSDIDNASKKVLSTMVSDLNEGGVSSSEADSALVKILSSGIKGIAEISLTGHEATHVQNAVGLVAGAVTASLGKLPGHSSSIIASRLKILAEGTSSGIGHLAADNAYARLAARVTLSEDNLLSLT